MKTVWRRECIDPCNTFYLQAMNSVQTAVDVLRPLVYEAIEATDTQAAQYMKHAPKASVARKRVNDSSEKMARMLKYEQNLRESLCANGSGMVSTRPPRSLVDELADELDKKDAAASLPVPLVAACPLMPSFASGFDWQLSTFSASPCIDAKLPAPSPKRVVVSATPSPVHVVKPLITTNGGIVVAETVTSALAPSPRLLPLPPQTFEAYEAVLDKLMDFDANSSIDAAFLVSLLTQFPRMHTTHSLVSVSPNLDALMKSLGVHGACHLLMKAMFSDWVGSAAKLSSSERLFVGFYVAPSLSLFQDIYRLSELPSFVSKATHRVEDSFASAMSRAALNGSRPVLVAYFGGTRPMIPGSNLLPLGIAC